MTRPDRPPFLRRKLGGKLRRMREQSGHTLESAAPLLDKTRSALHRIEIGETRADVHLIRSMMDLYDIYDPNLVAEAREALKPPWFRAYGIKRMGYVDAETEASEVHEFSVQVIPGLLQTRAYVEALFQPRGWDPRETGKHVIVRLIRQRRLTSDGRPLRVTAVVEEAALHHQVGGPEVMREQLAHLLEVATLPTVTLQVLPLAFGAHNSVGGAFTLLTFPDPDDLELLFVAYATGSLHIENAEEVGAAKLIFEQLRADALSPDDSIALIERLANEAPWITPT